MKPSDAIGRLVQKTGRSRATVERDMRILKKMRGDPGYFAKICFTKGEGWLYEPGTLAPFQQEQYDLIEEKHEKTLTLWPRGHAKTTLVSKIYVLHQVLFKHAEYVMLFSSTEKNKRGISTNHRQVFLDSFKFQELHYFLPYLMQSDKVLIKANETELVLGNGTRIEYVAVFGENRGASSAGRPDLVVMDDIIPSDASHSDTIRDGITDTWFSVIRFIGRDGCRFLGVGTVLHKDDLWSKISDGRIGGWKHVKLRAYDPDEPEETRNNTILWKERWTWAKLKKMYEEEYVADNKEYLWVREMLNDPATSQTNPFIDIDFQYYDVRHYDMRIIYGGQIISPQNMFRVIWIDHSQGTGNDDYVVMETGMDHRGYLYILKAFVSNTAGIEERIRVVKNFIRERQPNILGCERTSESLTFIDLLKIELKKSGYKIRIKDPTPQGYGAKNDRMADTLLPKFTDSKILLAREGLFDRAEDDQPGESRFKSMEKHKTLTDISSAVEEQLRRFDRTRKKNRDDIMDCLTWCWLFSRKPEAQDVNQTIPHDEIYEMRVRIDDVIQEQKKKIDQIGESDEAWPQIRGVC